MPDTWNAEIYRQRAEQWRQKAAELSEDGPGRRTCEAIAEGYAKLADLIDSSRRGLETDEGDPAKP
jgi:hypothetical protein